MNDYMTLYVAWEKLPPGPKAELRRVVRPDGLIEVPAFYRLFAGRGGKEWEKRAYQRLIYCLPCVRHTPDTISLGKALAIAKVGEKRLFQVVRSTEPNDMIQLRRILWMVEPKVNWPMMARDLWYWNDRSKRDLLEQFFLNQSK